jgi:hypothetical protein
MVDLAALLSVCLQLLPLVLWWIIRARRDRALWELALEIPAVIAVDMLLCLLLTRLFVLEIAVLSVRGGYLLVGGVLIVRRLRDKELAWPRCFRGPELATSALAGTLAVFLSTVMSRACHNFDRGWHIPLVASLRGQRLPFVNVYQPTQLLEYHYTGDALAASLQSLSLGVIHSSYALSLAHDYLFALTAIAAALLFRYLGVTSATHAALGAVAIFVMGPLTVLSPVTSTEAWAGYSIINFYKLSFRPHVPLAALLMVGFVGAIAVALRERGDRAQVVRTVAVLSACSALLSLTDEASIGLLGLSLGAAWLFVPQVLHERRLVGLGILALLTVCVIVPHFLFAGTLSTSSVANHVELVDWRSPGYYSRPIALARDAGWQRFKYDLLPMAMLAAGAVFMALRRPRRESMAVAIFYAVLFGLSVVALGRIEVVADVPLPPKGGWAVNNHRFVTAAMALMPVVALWLITAARVARRPATAGAFGSAVLVAAVTLSAVSTLQWLRLAAEDKCIQPRSFASAEDFYEIDCRKAVGAGLGERPMPIYAAKGLTYVYAGCRPSFLPARTDRLTYRLKLGGAAYGAAALAELETTVLAPEQPLTLVCPPPESATQEPACVFALSQGACAPAGQALRCRLGAQQRPALGEAVPGFAKHLRARRR